ncbi:MAG: hypothetical protein IJZ29_00890 [Clostridia bacterium]|nr:hypothetical protein [Clostridia bacterium]
MMANKYKLKFHIMSVEENAKNIFQFLHTNSDLDNWFSTTILDELGIDKSKLQYLNNSDRYKFILSKIENKLNQNQQYLSEKAKAFEEEWNSVSAEIFNIYSKIFNLQFNEDKHCQVNIGVNPICPRYIQEKSFDINYKQKSCIPIAIHELLHFYWFDYWNEHLYKLKDFEMENPTLTWAFSEIAIDTLVNCSPLLKYFSNTEVAYDYFYEIKYKDKPLVNVLRDLYYKNGLKTYMTEGFKIISSEDIKNKMLN